MQGLGVTKDGRFHVNSKKWQELYDNSDASTQKKLKRAFVRCTDRETGKVLFKEPEEGNCYDGYYGNKNSKAKNR